jgi:hypothetical protein
MENLEQNILLLKSIIGLFVEQNRERNSSQFVGVPRLRELGSIDDGVFAPFICSGLHCGSGKFEREV